MNISVVGLGLIGASLAKAIKKRTNHTVFGFDVDESVLNDALNDKAIDEIGNDKTLSQSDLVIVALYPQATIEFVTNKARIFKKNAVVSETCGIKQNVCKALSEVALNNEFTFVGAHPMAGKETSGYHSSDADLFTNAYMILTPTMEDINAVTMLTELSERLGFKSITLSTPLEHDRIIAYTSQLPHVLACAYISDPDAIKHDGFSAGSYKDVSRVAQINAKMWTELFIENRDCLCGHITKLIDNLTKLREYISSQNCDMLEKTLDNGDKIKKRIG